MANQQLKKRLKKSKDKIVHVANELNKEMNGDKNMREDMRVKINTAHNLLIEATNKLVEAING